MTWPGKLHGDRVTETVWEYITEVLVPHCIAGVTIMLSITIFATIVGEMLPVSDATPLIGLPKLSEVIAHSKNLILV